MVDATSILDPNKIPSIMLSKDELDEVESRIEAGELPADWFPRYYKAIEENVFGADAKHDSNGKPIEQGFGSPSNMTRQSIEAYRKWGKDDPGHEKNLAMMEKQLTECEHRRAAEARNAKPNKHGRVG